MRSVNNTISCDTKGRFKICNKKGVYRGRKIF